MSKTPLFTCVMPVKGARPYMADALASLEAQGLGDELEVIIQDADVEPDEGQSDALNRGFAKARGKWIFWLNADDILLPGALEAVRKVILARPEAKWIAGNLVYIDGDGKLVRCVFERGWKAIQNGLQVRVCGPSAFIRRDLWLEHGGFDNSLAYCMDTDLWCRFRSAGYWFAKVPRYVWGFRLHDNSKTASAVSGNPSDAMRGEIAALDKRHGITRSWRWRMMLLRLARILDGSTMKSILDTHRDKGVVL